MASDIATTRDGARHPSPPLVVLAVVHTVAFVASLVLTGLLTAGGHFPSPFAPSASAFDFLSRHHLAVRWSAFLQVGAAVPLGLFTATIASRLHFLGVRAAGVTIALFGGVAAAVFLALSAAVQWTLSWPDVLAAPGLARALHLLAFAAGGPAHVMAVGILLAGVSVTGGLQRLLPRWMMATGLVLATIAELSWLCLVLPSASYLLPLARFPGFAWLIVTGALLPDRRKAARVSSPRPDPALALPAGVAAKEGV